MSTIQQCKKQYRLWLEKRDMSPLNIDVHLLVTSTFLDYVREKKVLTLQQIKPVYMGMFERDRLKPDEDIIMFALSNFELFIEKAKREQRKR